MKKGGIPHESWRKWLVTLLALGFALLVITMLLQQNEILRKTIADMRAAAMGEEQEDEYPLSFDLPEGWIMTEGCTAMMSGERRNVNCGDDIVDIETTAELPVLDRVISPDATYVYLQNTDRLPLFGGIAPHEAVRDAYQSNGVAVITVAKIGGKDILMGNTGEVTDLGEGFYRVTTCDVVANPECQMYGQWADEYYFFGETGAYRMSVMSTLSNGTQTIKEIILSAHEEKKSRL